ncbi:glycoside hydrolase family 75 protein [Brevibacillus dissolubilis]|uniref:glycoside hydrolase family 75 protein n=1 Tax=Brevibacillus dissolubilis TaxID=1844116 RepID=UPI00159BA310|nr:glycoside hydrolase family 75 protein [Brevibacillus dissolubilis]
MRWQPDPYHYHPLYGAANPYPSFFPQRESSDRLVKIETIQGREGAVIYRYKNAVIFKSDMDIDIDGDPAAYHPNRRLAKTDFNVHAIAKDERGRLCPVQRQGDPHPGYYPSGTSLYDFTYWLQNRCDPRAYVDPNVYPYFVLPYPHYKDPKWGPVRIGDLGVVINTKNGKMAYAIFADAFLGHFIGEGSLALARELGIDDNPNTGGEETKSIIYLVFPGSGKGQGTVPSIEEIRQTAAQYFNAWGGQAQVEAIQGQLR